MSEQTPQTTENLTIKDEKRRKKLMMIAAVSVFVLFGALVAYLYQSQQKYTPPPPEPKINLHGSSDIARESWIAQSAQQLQEQKKQIEDTQATLKSLDAKIDKIAGGKGDHPPGSPPVPQSPPAGQLAVPPPPPSSGAAHGQFGQPGTPAQPVEKVLTNLIAMEESGGAKTALAKDAKGEAKGKDKKEDSKEASESKEVDKKKNEAHIPAGSFVRVVLMTGIDAPSGARGKGSPYPVLLKIIDHAQLPNKWRSDIEGCFMIGEAYGELSSERVHIRVNSISCVGKEGEMITGNASGYVVGEDGKTGLSGLVVTKQGAILSRSLITGFLQGVSQAFSQSATVLNVTPTGNVSTLDPSKSLQAGLGMGATKASEELAKFYMEMAKEMFPVIEVNAGRKVEVVLTQKVTLAKRL